MFEIKSALELMNADLQYIFSQCNAMRLEELKAKQRGTVILKSGTAYLREREMIEGKLRRKADTPIGHINSPEFRRYLLERYSKILVQRMEHNQRVLEEAVKEILACDYDSIMGELPEWAMQANPITTGELSDFLTARGEGGRRRKAESIQTREPSRILPADRLVGIDGTELRSKSEVSIDLLLTKHNIEHVYEERLEIKRGGGVVDYVRPDFTLYLAFLRKKWWEHAGMMDDPDYRDNYFSKMGKFGSIGIYPGRDLIVTYDTREHPLNMLEIENIIKYQVLPYC